MKVTKELLLEAAWVRFQAARDAVLAREAMTAANKPWEAAKDRFRKAHARADEALRQYQNMEDALLLQEAGPERREFAELRS